MSAANSKRDNPMGQSGTISEAPILLFTEFTRKDGDSTATVHLTMRDINDENLYSRLEYAIGLMSNLGFKHADAPKQQWSGRGGYGGKQPQAPKVEIKEERDAEGRVFGAFEVGSVALFKRTVGDKVQNNVKAFGVQGEECVSWEGKSLDALLKSASENVSKEFSNWADWKQDEQHLINWQTHNLVAHCKKSAIKQVDGKTTGGKWYIDSFEITDKVK